jgi:hypothetical protein
VASCNAALAASLIVTELGDADGACDATTACFDSGGLAWHGVAVGACAAFDIAVVMAVVLFEGDCVHSLDVEPPVSTVPTESLETLAAARKVQRST